MITGLGVLQNHDNTRKSVKKILSEREQLQMRIMKCIHAYNAIMKIRLARQKTLYSGAFLSFYWFSVLFIVNKARERTQENIRMSKKKKFY